MKKKNYAIKLKPFIADYIWGGFLLSKEWGKSSPVSDGKIAEAWEVSVFPQKESIVDGGEFDGLTLSDLLIKHPDLFGERMRLFERFPLLVKIINSEKRLSIQVHPSDQYALKNEGQLGKTEIWYIAEAKPDACVYIGFCKDTSKAEVLARLTDGSIEEILNKVIVKKGDLIPVNPGIVHALLEGVVVVEIQENSNLTYRLYDYNRVDSNGNKRELHIDKALEIINYQKTDIESNNTAISNDIGKDLVVLKKTPYFNAYMKSITQKVKLMSNESFITVTAINGKAKFANGQLFEKGSTFFIPVNNEVSFTPADKYDEFVFVAVTLGTPDLID